MLGKASAKHRGGGKKLRKSDSETVLGWYAYIYIYMYINIYAEHEFSLTKSNWRVREHQAWIL